MPIKPRRYFDYIERDPDKVSLRWKYLHLMVFVLTSFNSFASTVGFQDIFDIFNYRCCLYAKALVLLKPYFYITNTTDDSLNTTRNSGVNPLIFHDSYFDSLSNSDEKFRSMSNENFKLPGVPNVYVKNSELWYINDTIMGLVHMHMLKTVFTTVLLCDLVLFVPMISIVISAVLAALIILCGRGGGGRKTDILRQSWLIVYPIIVVSAVMAILSIITTNSVKNGLEIFCSRFEEFTGVKECSPIMDYITTEQGHGKRSFYLMYLICYYSFHLSTGLWLFQLLLGILRLVCVVDFQLRSVLIKSKKHDITEEDQEMIRSAVITSFPRLTEDTWTSFVDEFENGDEKISEKQEVEKITGV